MHSFSEVELLLFFFLLPNSVRDSIISGADDFDFRFFFLFKTPFAKGNSSSSSVHQDPALAVGNEETMAGGIIFRSLRKTLLARLQSRTPSCQALSWRCPLVLFCLFFLPFIVALQLLCIFIPCNFSTTLPLSKRSFFPVVAKSIIECSMTTMLKAFHRSPVL